MKIANIIKAPPHTINVNDTIDTALALINSLKINGLPVIDDNKKLVGMVVKADIYRFMVQPGHFDSCPVEWVMSKSVIVAQSDEDILSVGKRLRENSIIAMPVVENDEVIGIITIENLLDYFITA